MPSVLLLQGCSEFFLRGHENVAVDPVVVTESFVQEALPLVDVLWVVDDTSSMADELVALGAASQAFVSSLNELDLSWQLGLVSMDTSEGGGGLLLGKPWIVTPETPDGAAAFERTLALPPSTTSEEAGLAAAWLALSPPLSTGDNRGFRRDGASLEVVFFSDGDDDGDSDAVLGADALGAFVDLLSDEADASKRVAVASAIVGDVPAGCTGETGQALPGTAFAAAAEATGGIVRSVCDPDLGPIVTQIGESAAVWPTRFPLQAIPIPDSLRVQVDGLRTDDGWALEISPEAIVFDEAPPPDAVIIVQYEVAP